MKKIILFFMAVVLVSGLSSSTYVSAALLDRGGGLIYDDVLDITWLQNSTLSGNTMTWDEAFSWSDSLVYMGYNDWRLPVADAACSGMDCPGNEMAYLYHNYNITYSSPGVFTDIKNYMYWSGTEDAANTANALRFSFGFGSQGVSPKTSTRYAWAVRDGDSIQPVAPEPVSSLLFITGGAALGFGRYWKQRRN